MVIIYFDNEYHEYYHAKYYQGWPQYDRWRANECAWLIPGTDPDDCFYN